MSDSASVPRISLVMPSLNQAPYVDTAIRSILTQDYENRELIVVDGASTDGSVERITPHAAQLGHWIREADRGPAHALNKGFRRASGDILGFVNADDFLLPGALSRVASEFRARPHADVLSGHGFLARPSGELGARIFSDSWNATRFVHGACVLVQAATFFRRSVFERTGGFNEANQTTWDMELWADLAVAGATFEVVPAFLAAHRVHRRSISGRPQLRGLRFQEARGIREKMRGRRELRIDRLNALAFRSRKFLSHPLRTFTQRLFLYSTLQRWSL